jgi:hypothetical protein
MQKKLIFIFSIISIAAIIQALILGFSTRADDHEDSPWFNDSNKFTLTNLGFQNAICITLPMKKGQEYLEIEAHCERNTKISQIISSGIKDRQSPDFLDDCSLNSEAERFNAPAFEQAFL